MYFASYLHKSRHQMLTGFGIECQERGPSDEIDEADLAQDASDLLVQYVRKLLVMVERRRVPGPVLAEDVLPLATEPGGLGPAPASRRGLDALVEAGVEEQEQVARNLFQHVEEPGDMSHSLHYLCFVLPHR